MSVNSIVVIEDDPDLLPILCQTIELFGNFVVYPAADGAAGLAAIVTHHPVCAVIDLKMPELDGYQVIQAVRGDPETASIPLVVLTALAQDRDRWRGLVAGTDVYLTKPASGTVLIDAIHQAMGVDAEERHRRLEELAQQ